MPKKLLCVLTGVALTSLTCGSAFGSNNKAMDADIHSVERWTSPSTYVVLPSAAIDLRPIYFVDLGLTIFVFSAADVEAITII